MIKIAKTAARENFLGILVPTTAKIPACAGMTPGGKTPKIPVFTGMTPGGGKTPKIPVFAGMTPGGGKTPKISACAGMTTGGACAYCLLGYFFFFLNISFPVIQTKK